MIVHFITQDKFKKTIDARAGKGNMHTFKQRDAEKKKHHIGNP